MHNHLERNLIGYGPNPPDPQWPNEARIAVSFVLNYEEGGENTILNGDAASEVFLTETPGGTPIVGGRDLSTESMYEYGSRAGFWRVMRLFGERNMRFTSWAVGRALELNPAAGKAMAEAGHEVASHGYRWINYKDFTLEQELDHMKKAVKAIADTAGKPPVGWLSMWLPLRTGAADASVPSRRTNRLPMASVKIAKPRALAQPASLTRAAASSGDSAWRFTPPLGVPPSFAMSAWRCHRRCWLTDLAPLMLAL